MKTFKPKRGFTLIELLVVISIIGLLSTIVLASLTNARQKAQGVAINQSLVQLRNAIELYRASNSTYPAEWVSGPNMPAPHTSNGYPTDGDDFYEVLEPLISQKYIPVLPTSQIFTFTYESWPAAVDIVASGGYYMCGDKPFGNYTLVVEPANNNDLNSQKILQESKLPPWIQCSSDNGGPPWTCSPPDKAYCITN